MELAIGLVLMVSAILFFSKKPDTPPKPKPENNKHSIARLFFPELQETIDGLKEGIQVAKKESKEQNKHE